MCLARRRRSQLKSGWRLASLLPKHLGMELKAYHYINRLERHPHPISHPYLHCHPRGRLLFLIGRRIFPLPWKTVRTMCLTDAQYHPTELPSDHIHRHEPRRTTRDRLPLQCPMSLQTSMAARVQEHPRLDIMVLARPVQYDRFRQHHCSRVAPDRFPATRMQQ